MKSNSALKEHYLSSVLPYFNKKEQNQISKTKDFYKPEQFIWNNPHRTSKKIYPYYHQFNDQYVQAVQPKIQQLEEDDRINANRQRIRKLSQFRQQTRQKFFSRQKEREQLQARSNYRKRQYSTLDTNNFQIFNNRNEKQIKYPSVRKVTEKLENNYKQSVQNYDLKMNTIRDLINDQVKSKQNQIRNQFMKQKKMNQLTNSTIKKRSLLHPS